MSVVLAHVRAEARTLQGLMLAAAMNGCCSDVGRTFWKKSLSAACVAAGGLSTPPPGHCLKDNSHWVRRCNAVAATGCARVNSLT